MSSRLITSCRVWTAPCLARTTCIMRRHSARNSPSTPRASSAPCLASLMFSLASWWASASTQCTRIKTALSKSLCGVHSCCSWAGCYNMAFHAARRHGPRAMCSSPVVWLRASWLCLSMLSTSRATTVGAASSSHLASTHCSATWLAHF